MTALNMETGGIGEEYIREQKAEIKSMIATSLRQAQICRQIIACLDQAPFSEEQWSECIGRVGEG